MEIKTRIRHVMMSSDYSSQEPKLMAQLCDDEKMLGAFRQGKDLYVQIASVAFGYPYEQCLEHFPEGTPIKKINGAWVESKDDYDKLANGKTDVNEAGKERRRQAKSILLGILYGRGERSIAEQLNCDSSEARDIKNAVFLGFPAIKEFEEDSMRMARDLGYVTTLWGRKRRLPDFQLPDIEVLYEDGTNAHDIDSAPWIKKLRNVRRFTEKLDIIKKAKSQGFIIRDNSGKIADASRQVINSRVQGCLVGTTKIQTKKYGIVNIEKVVGQTLEIWDGENWTNGTVVYSGKKIKHIIHFKHNSGSIECSEDHKFLDCLTNGNVKWKTCKQLKPGSRLKTSTEYGKSDYIYKTNMETFDAKAKNANAYHLDQILDSYDAGLFLGRLASDGSFGVRRNGNGGTGFGLFIAEHEFNILDKLEKIVQCFDKNIKHKINKLRPGRTQQIATIGACSLSLVRELEYLNIKHEVHEELFKDTEMLRGFIAGFYDSSGRDVVLTFDKNKDFTNILNGLQLALRFFGIRSTVQTYANCYRLRVIARDYVNYLKTCSFMNSKKINATVSRINRLSKTRAGKSFRNMKFLIVDRVEKTNDLVDMYDVCNTDNGYFVADGFVTHNSAADMMKKSLIAVNTNKEFKDLKGRVLITVHDELIATAPLRFVREARRLFATSMEKAAEDRLTIPISCDVTTTFKWFGEELDIQKELGGLDDGIR